MKSEITRHSEKLNYFYEIANNNSIQQASRKLNISAPTLSYSIKQLEEALKIELFIRTSKGMSLTIAGKKLYDFCVNYFHEIETLEQSILNQNTLNQKLQKIKIGTFPSIAIYLWPKIHNLLISDTTISPAITTGRSYEILELLQKRIVDVSITVGAHNRKGIIQKELYSDSYSFYISKQIKVENDILKNTNTYPLFYFPQAEDQNQRTLVQYLRSWNLFFKSESELDSFESIAEFTKLNMGIGLLPNKTACYYKEYIKPIIIKGLPKSFGTHQFFFSYRTDLDIKKSILDSIFKFSQISVKV